MKVGDLVRFRNAIGHDRYGIVLQHIGPKVVACSVLWADGVRGYPGVEHLEVVNESR